MSKRSKRKIAFIGGGSQMWAPTIIRDIVFKKGMDKVDLEFALLDTCLERAERIKSLFDARFAEWKVDHVSMFPTSDYREGLTGADFVIIAISTGWLDAMKHDLAIPEQYGIYHTVGDTCGPGGWSRSIRNIPVFKFIAEQVRQYAPGAYVLNYTNPMGTLTKVLADELGSRKVVGLCHGLFECHDVLKAIFNLKSEDQIQVRFGGLNHFFWILDMAIDGRDGYPMLREKLNGRNFAQLVTEVHKDGIGFSSDKWLAGELFDNYGYLPYMADRHTCEFFNCYMTRRDLMERLKLVRTTIEDRRAMYERAPKRIELWAEGRRDPEWGAFTKKPSRETAADIIKALIFSQGFTDVVNMPNSGQISNLPEGVVVETMGLVDNGGFFPLITGSLPEPIRAVIAAHAEVQLRIVQAVLAGDREEALMALVADPVCAHLSASDIKKMGSELLEANREFIPKSLLE